MKIVIKIAAIVVAGLFLNTSIVQAETKKMNSPKHKALMLDWCYDWGEVGCGKRVANAYCKSKGFKKSVGYKKWENPGRPTRQISNNSICDADYCDSFSFIMCER